ncbi:MAG: hypothetical protein ABI333_21055 [bacterium]
MNAEEQAQRPSGWIRTARRALTVMRAYSFIGLLMAIVLGALSFFFYKVELSRWICRLGAMGCLVGAAAGLNVMDRLVRGRRFPVGLVAAGLALIAVAFVGVGVGAVKYNLGAAWSPLVAACYIFVLARILMRFRAPEEQA